MTESAKSLYHVFIPVFKGAPGDDYVYTRHAALWFKARNGSHSIYCHVKKNEDNEYEYELRRNIKPTRAKNFAQMAVVAVTSYAMSRKEVEDMMESVLVDNHDCEFNSHQWVHQGLIKLMAAQSLTPRQCDQGLCDMVAILLEAVDMWGRRVYVFCNYPWGFCIFEESEVAEVSQTLNLSSDSSDNSDLD